MVWNYGFENSNHQIIQENWQYEKRLWKGFKYSAQKHKY